MAGNALPSEEEMIHSKVVSNRRRETEGAVVGIPPRALSIVPPNGGSKMSKEDVAFWENLNQGFRAAKIGAAWYNVLKERLEKDHYDKFVVVDPKTGQYVVGISREDASSRFENQFGQGVFGFEARVGESIIVGASSWSL